MTAQPDIQILTQVLEIFNKVFGTGKGALFPWSMRLTMSLVAIEIVMMGLWHALKGGDANEFIMNFIRKIMVIGFFIFLVTGIAQSGLADMILEGFIAVGLKAGGSGISFNMKDPSSLILSGFLAADPIITAIEAFPMSFGGLADTIMAYACYVVVILAYALMAFQVLITFIEFGIVSTLGVILLPFGVSKHTAFLAEKAIGAIISFGIKLMVLSFVIAVIQPVLVAIPPLGADPTQQQMMGLAVTVMVIALIVAQAPGVASAVLSGSPSLSAGVAAGTAVSAAAGVVGAAGGVGLAAKSAAQGLSAVNTAAGATGQGAIQAAGTISGFRKAAASEAGQALGTSASSLMAGAVGDSIKSSVGNAVSSTVGSFKSAEGRAMDTGMSQIAAKTPTKDTEAGGSESSGEGSGAATAASGAAAGTGSTKAITGGAGGEKAAKVTSSLQKSPPPGDRSGPGTSGGSNRSSLQDVLNQGKQGIPQDAAPSAGADVRIHHD